MADVIEYKTGKFKINAATAQYIISEPGRAATFWPRDTTE